MPATDTRPEARPLTWTTGVWPIRPLDHLVITRRHQALVSSCGTFAVTDQQRLVNGLVDLEITERIQAFEEAEAALDAQELAHIAGTPDEKAPGVHAPHARLLLLLPVLGDADLPQRGCRAGRDALVQTGVAAGNAASLAQALLHRSRHRIGEEAFVVDDLLHLMRMFGISAQTAMRYITARPTCTAKLMHPLLDSHARSTT